MHRYTEVLARAYRDLGVWVTVLRPPQVVSARWPWPGRKWIGYAEKFLAFWPVLWWHALRADAVHIADHSDAIWALGILRRRVVVTCHDLIAIRAALGELPEHRPGISGRAYQAIVRRGLVKAETVLSVSRSTAADVERLTGRRSPCLYNPLDDAVLLPAVTDMPPVVPIERYLLVVSTRSWRKRRVASVTAWVRLRRTHAFRDCCLVVVGDPLGPEEVAAAEGATHELLRISGVSDAELARLYAGARGLLQLSRYEGFGWPIVEAQAHRVPVLATDGAIFRETAGDHACFVTDDQLHDLSAQTWQRIADTFAAVDVAAAAASVERFRMRTFTRELRRFVVGDEARPVAGVTYDLTADPRQEASA
jgi:glycosyltransferase involved in cell wall biosynthesis